MMDAFRRVAIIALLSFFTSCGVPISNVEVAKSVEAELLLKILGELQARDYTSVRAQMDSQSKAMPGIDKMLEYLTEIIPAGAPISSQFEGWWVNVSTNTGRTSGVTAILEFKDSWLMVVATYSGDQKSLLATTYTVQPAAKLASGVSPFQPQTSAPLRYFNLVVAVSATLVSIVGAVVSVLMMGMKRKWLWFSICVLGISGFSFNSTTGDFLINFLDFGGFDPSWYWPDASVGQFVHVVLPVGAIVYFIKRRQYLKSRVRATSG